MNNPVDSVELSTIYLFLENAVLLVPALIINLTRASETAIGGGGIFWRMSDWRGRVFRDSSLFYHNLRHLDFTVLLQWHC